MGIGVTFRRFDNNLRHPPLRRNTIILKNLDDFELGKATVRLSASQGRSDVGLDPLDDGFHGWVADTDEMGDV